MRERRCDKDCQRGRSARHRGSDEHILRARGSSSKSNASRSGKIRIEIIRSAGRRLDIKPVSAHRIRSADCADNNAVDIRCGRSCAAVGDERIDKEARHIADRSRSRRCNGRSDCFAVDIAVGKSWICREGRICQDIVQVRSSRRADRSSQGINRADLQDGSWRSGGESPRQKKRGDRGNCTRSKAWSNS